MRSAVSSQIAPEAACEIIESGNFAECHAHYDVAINFELGFPSNGWSHEGATLDFPSSFLQLFDGYLDKN